MNTNTTSRRRFLAGVLGTGMGIVSHKAVFGKTQTEPIEKGFIRIFNGHNLDGWHTNTQKIVHGYGGHWQAEHGTLTGEQDPPGNGGVLMSDQEYGDFELRLELAPDWGIDSGVFLRTNPRGECFQVYVDYHDHGNVGWLSTETRSGQKRMIIRPFDIFGKFNDQGVLTGLTTKPDERKIAWNPDYLVYSATPEEWLATWKIGRWNRLRVRCIGKYPHITTWINDVKMAEFDGQTCPQPNYNKEKLFGMLGRKGPIAFQVHGGNQMWTKGAKCRWRNIRIKPL
jgi:3-keto-disaccharide hydrolase